MQHKVDLQKVVIGGVYRHYKNKLNYLVIGTSWLVGDDDYVVHYLPLYECDKKAFARKLSEFIEVVKGDDDLMQPRYLFVDREGRCDMLTILTDVLYSAQMAKIALLSFLSRYNGQSGLDLDGLKLATDYLRRSIP